MVTKLTVTTITKMTREEYEALDKKDFEKAAGVLKNEVLGLTMADDVNLGSSKIFVTEVTR